MTGWNGFSPANYVSNSSCTREANSFLKYLLIGCYVYILCIIMTICITRHVWQWHGDTTNIWTHNTTLSVQSYFLDTHHSLPSASVCIWYHHQHGWGIGTVCLHYMSYWIQSIINCHVFMCLLDSFFPFASSMSRLADKASSLPSSALFVFFSANWEHHRRNGNYWPPSVSLSYSRD